MTITIPSNWLYILAAGLILMPATYAGHEILSRQPRHDRYVSCLAQNDMPRLTQVELSIICNRLYGDTPYSSGRYGPRSAGPITLAMRGYFGR